LILRLHYLWKNLSRNPLRTALTIAAVGLPMVIFVLSSAVVRGVERFLDNSAQQLRLAVTNRASIVYPLPMSYAAKIRSLDPTGMRLLAVCGMSWIGGKVQDDPRPLSTLAADAGEFIRAFPDYRLPQDEIDAWLRDRQAIIIGRATAAQFGWKKGQRITIRPSLPPYTPMEFHVVSTAENATDPQTNWCHYSYYQEELKRVYRGGTEDEDRVGFYFVRCATRADLDHFRQEIDKLFERSLDETKTQDEKAFMNEFITQQFDLPRNLTILALVTVFVAVMAATNTMSMNFRDRINEFATLKALGFRGTWVFLLIQSESLLLCAIGGLLGAAAPYIAFTHTPLRNFTVPVIQTLEVSLRVCAHAVLISIAIGLIAAVWPSWQVLKLRVVTALRNLD